MAEKQTFTIRVRQFATGEVYAVSHHEIEHGGADLDDIAQDVESAYREFDLVVSATPPIDEETPDVAVDVPDDADSVAVDVPDIVPA